MQKGFLLFIFFLFGLWQNQIFAQSPSDKISIAAVEKSKQNLRSAKQGSTTSELGKQSNNDGQANNYEYRVAIQILDGDDLNTENSDVDNIIAKELKTLLLSISEAHRLEGKPPAGALILHRRAKADLPQLMKALRSRGYYSASIEYHIEQKTSPLQLQFNVITGKRYVIESLSVNLTQQSPQQIKLPSAEQLQISLGSPADARKIIQAEQKLILNLKQQAFAYAQLKEKTFKVNHQTRTMHIQYLLQSGPKVYIHQVRFDGIESIQDKFLVSLIPWQKPTPYHPDLMEQATQNFSETDLFSTVRVVLPGENNSQQREQILAKWYAEKREHKKTKSESSVPENAISAHSNVDNLEADAMLSLTLVTLKERKHRTIKGRVAFETDTGIALSALWTHRNLFGGGEKLSVEGAWSSVGPLFSIFYNKPNFLRSKQAFVAGLELKSEDTDAYKSSSFDIWGGIERQLRPGMDITMGIGFTYRDIEDKSLSDDEQKAKLPVDSSENYALLYLPLKFNWDFSNNLFEPNRGGKLLIEGSPFMDINSDLRFGKLYARYIHYQKITTSLVLAGRIAMGNIFGAEAEDIPADERFYAGGGGSIRGYGYQLASPLDRDGDPQGGNALLEFALETRIHFGQNMGAVAFVDAGAAFAETLFDASNDVRYGAGLGLRYTSPIGPLRADIAMPLQRRKNIDDAFQLYLSIGHAF